MTKNGSMDKRPLRLGCGRAGVALLTAAVVLLASSTGFARERGRRWAQEARVADACWVAAPTVCADVTACPAVTSPGATVARFSVLPLSMIATVVDVRVTRDVLVARIGGLYGP